MVRDLTNAWLSSPMVSCFMKITGVGFNLNGKNNPVINNMSPFLMTEVSHKPVIWDRNGVSTHINNSQKRKLNTRSVFERQLM